MYWTFGYGSILNSKTWSVSSDYKLSCLKGWKRTWRHAVHLPTGSYSALTIEPDLNSRIEGIMLATDNVQHQRLHAREISYKLIDIPKDTVNLQTGECPTSLDIKAYQALASNLQNERKLYPIQQSYLDCILQGYYEHYGIKGLESFMNTTEFGNAEILQDRHSPLYPRHIEISNEQRALFDSLIYSALTPQNCP